MFLRDALKHWYLIKGPDQFSGRGIYKYIHQTLQQMHQSGWMWIIAWDLVPVEAIYTCGTGFMIEVWNPAFLASVRKSRILNYYEFCRKTSDSGHEYVRRKNINSPRFWEVTDVNHKWSKDIDMGSFDVYLMARPRDYRSYASRDYSDVKPFIAQGLPYGTSSHLCSDQFIQYSMRVQVIAL